MSARLPDVTIFADAALCLETGAAGWGAWMISRSKPSHTCGGPLKETFSPGGGCSSEVELFALANAIHVAIQKGYLRDGMVVMLQSDSLNALGFIRHALGADDRPMKTKQEGVPVPRKDPRCFTRSRRKPQVEEPRADWRRRGLAAVERASKDHKLTFLVRHVRGHRSDAASEGDGRAWVNETCDRLAKAGKFAAKRKLLEGAENG